MSDLDELKPFLIDDMVIAAAAGKINGMSGQDVANLMTNKITTVFEIQEALNIDYTMDELVVAQDYWVNTTLDRPVRGLEAAPAIEE